MYPFINIFNQLTKASLVNLITLGNSVTNVLVSTILVSKLGFLEYSDLVKILLFSGIISQVISLPTQEMILSNNVKFHEIFFTDIIIALCSITLFVGVLNYFDIQYMFLYGFALFFDIIGRSLRSQSLETSNYFLGYLDLVFITIFKFIFIIYSIFNSITISLYIIGIVLAYFMSWLTLLIYHRKLINLRIFMIGPFRVLHSPYVRASWLNTTSKSLMSKVDLIALLAIGNDVLLGQFELIKRYCAGPSLLNSMYANRLLPRFFKHNNPCDNWVKLKIIKSYRDLFGVTLLNLIVLLILNLKSTFKDLPLYFYFLGSAIVYFESTNWWTKILVYSRKGYLNIYEFLLRLAGFTVLILLTPKSNMLILVSLLAINLIIMFFWILIYYKFYEKYN